VFYYKPLTLNTTTCSLVNPAGVFPPSLDRRTFSSSAYLPCTVFTLNSTAYRIPAFAMTAEYSPTCDKTNDPYVASFSTSGTGISLTPAYNLHVDYYEAFMSGSIPTSDYHLTLRVSVPGNRLPAITTPSRFPRPLPTQGHEANFAAQSNIFSISKD